MRKRTWVSARLDAWGWHWAAKIQRGAEPPWPVGTLGRDGPGGNVPGPRCPLVPADWMDPETLGTHRSVCTLPEIFRDVVMLHHIYPERPAKLHCHAIGIAPSVYYWRLEKAHRLVAHHLIDGPKLESVQLESQTVRL